MIDKKNYDLDYIRELQVRSRQTQACLKECFTRLAFWRLSLRWG